MINYLISVNQLPVQMKTKGSCRGGQKAECKQVAHVGLCYILPGDCGAGAEAVDVRILGSSAGRCLDTRLMELK